MDRKELAPLKSMIKHDPAAELARIDAEVSVVHLQADKLSKIGLLVGLGGLLVCGLITAVFYLFYGWFVLWGGPAVLAGVISWFFVNIRTVRLRARADFLMQQKRETKALMRQAELKARG